MACGTSLSSNMKSRLNIAWVTKPRKKICHPWLTTNGGNAAGLATYPQCRLLWNNGMRQLSNQSLISEGRGDCSRIMLIVLIPPANQSRSLAIYGRLLALNSMSLPQGNPFQPFVRAAWLVLDSYPSFFRFHLPNLVVSSQLSFGSSGWFWHTQFLPWLIRFRSQHVVEHPHGSQSTAYISEDPLLIHRLSVISFWHRHRLPFTLRLKL